MAKAHRFPWKWYLRDLKPATRDVRVFSCFSCAGGSSMGYKLAGFNVVGNCEIDPKVNTAYNNNLHPEISIGEDIRHLAASEVFPDELYGLDILDGSPPCTTFSLAGDREKSWGKTKKFAEGRAEQRLDDLFFPFIKLCGKLKPRVCIAENVAGILIGNAKIYHDAIIRAFHAIGYDVQVFLLDAANAGVPQYRKRVFFVANNCGFRRLSLNFTEPEIPLGEVIDFSRPRRKVGGKLGIYLSAVEPGDRSLSDAAMRVRGKRSCFSLRLVYPDRPASTLTASSDMFTLDGHVLDTLDYTSIATFPQDYDFCGVKPHYAAGMCVPPVLMANIAEEIYRQWLSNRTA